MNRSTKIAACVAAVVVVAGGVYFATNSGSSSDKKFTVAMITDAPGNIDDHSFNQSAWEGLQAWGKENGVKKGVDGYNYFLSKTKADFTNNFDQAVAAKFDYIAGIGFDLQEATQKAAKANPKTEFALVDSVADSKYKNIQSLMFNSEQSSYLAGVAAAEKAEEVGDTKIGFLGGVKSETVGRFEYGFRLGVASVNKSLKVESVYANSFGDAAKGQLIANTFIAEGIHVIYHAAGGTGNGAFTAVKQHDQTLKSGSADKVYMIGVDVDQSSDGAYKTKDGKSDNFTLTSALKNVGKALQASANSAKDGKFKGGKATFYGLKQGGVGIVKKNLDAKTLKAVNKAQKALENGSITLKYTTQYSK